LEADWVERPLAITVAGRSVTGLARANWGALEVSITGPIRYWTRRRDARGWAFALCVHVEPEQRFARGGQLTARGRREGERMLADMYLDWLAVSSQQGAVDVECRRTEQRLNELNEAFAARRQPLLRSRLALRQAFKASELTQSDHQRLRKENQKKLNQLECDRQQAEGTVQGEFAQWMQHCCGRQVSLHAANHLLREVAVVAQPASRPT
jgi:hypothetical protein